MDSKIEPVAWRWRADDDAEWEYSDFDHGGAEPLYTAAALLAAEQRGRESERERCAQIADDGAEQADRAFRGFTALNAAAFMHGRARAVAAAIRKGE